MCVREREREWVEQKCGDMCTCGEQNNANKTVPVMEKWGRDMAFLQTCFLNLTHCYTTKGVQTKSIIALVIMPLYSLREGPFEPAY